jgi:hypothetical protein
MGGAHLEMKTTRRSNETHVLCRLELHGLGVLANRTSSTHSKKILWNEQW